LSSDETHPAPLIGDPARQAPHLHRGIEYQIWKSVEAWIHLDENEILYLEGAEDFDIVSAGEGTAVQVKATTGRLTLRSRDIISALHNFWVIKEANKKGRLLYRFVTTSERGLEQGEPFGKGDKGLDLWTFCKESHDQSIAERIQFFLARDESVQQTLCELEGEDRSFGEKTLLDFLQKALPSQILRDLILPISFETGGGDAKVVRESVAIRLRHHGGLLGILPSDCDKAIDRLYRIAAETAASSERRVLSRDMFLREFEKATTATVPLSQFRLLTSQMSSLAAATAITSSGGDFAIHSATFPVTEGIPPPPPNILDREELVNGLQERIQQFGTILIQGSSGMGKSTLAKILAKRVGEKWLWVDFQDLLHDHVLQIFQGFMRLCYTNPTITNLALDNLNLSSSELSIFENQLAAIIRMVRERAGCVILTSTRELTYRLRDNISLHSENDIRVPPFSEEEIGQFCILQGCPDPALSRRWAKIVRIHTAGHPTLVHSRMVVLRDKSWPHPTLDDLHQTPVEILDELDIARQLLDELSMDEKELLYRLSLLVGPFRRDHAVAIAETDRRLEFPGDIFDRLYGPWVEPAGNHYFRLSPLLQKAGERNWSSKQIQTVRAAIARALLSCDNPTLLEAGEMLLQGLLANEVAVVTSVATRLNAASVDKNRALADSLPWLAFLAHGSGQRAVSGSPFANFLVRILQFRVITVRSIESLEAICNSIDEEVTEVYGDLGDSCRLWWMTQVLVTKEARLPHGRLLDYWLQVQELSASKLHFRKLISDVEQAPSTGSYTMEKDSFRLLLLMILARGSDSQGVVEFFRAIDGLNPQDRSRILEHMAELLLPVRLVVSQILINEVDSPSPDWQAVLSSLAAIGDLARKWGFADLGVLVSRTTAAIEDEYCDDPAKALQTLDTAENMGSSLGYLIQDQWSLVLYRQDRYEEVIAIGHKIIPSWPTEPDFPDLQLLFVCNRSGSAAGRMSRLEEAQFFFEHGVQSAVPFDSPLYRLAFLADLAHTQWKLDDRPRALSNLIAVLEGMAELEDGNENNLHFHWVWKSVEQVVRWFLKDSGTLLTDEVIESPLGFCSRPVGGDEILEFPRCSLDLSWLLLAEAEYYARAGREVFRRAVSYTKRSRFAAVRIGMTQLELYVAFEDGNLSEVPRIAAAHPKTFSEVKAQERLGNPPHLPDLPTVIPDNDPTGWVEAAIVYAFIALSSQGRPLNSYFSDWTGQLEQFSNGTSLLKDLGLVEAVLALEKEGIQRVYEDPERTRLERLVAGVLMLANPESSLTQSFIGGIFLFDALGKLPFGIVLGEWFGRLVKIVWERRCAFPAEFPSPRVTIPPIQEACTNGGTGLRLAARILLEVRAAVNVPMQDEILAQLCSRVQGESSPMSQEE